MRPFVFAIFLCVSLIQAQYGPSKRGLAHGNTSFGSDSSIWNAEASPLTWYYNFKKYPSNDILPWKMQFIPMMFDNSPNNSDFYDLVKGYIDAGRNISYVLGFNEPDICYGGGSCIDAASAAESWKKHIEPLKKHGVKLGAPSVTGGNTVWLNDFYEACDGGCTIDFIPLHFYSDIVGIKEWVHEIHKTYKDVTIWMTEFACPQCSLDVAQLAFNESVDFFQSQDYVTHYAYFGSFRTSQSNDFLGPNVAMLNDNGGLTDIGVWYLDLPASAVGKTNIGPEAVKPKDFSDTDSSGSTSAASGHSVGVALSPYLGGWWVLAPIAVFIVSQAFV